MQSKLIKDPVFGFIKIDNQFVLRALDTAEFQRLRNIQQTSYTSLYPAAVHNRFLHSIGVYHLGNKVISALLSNMDEDVRIILSKHIDTFLLACLLHDVGHAPFSHSGENFFLQAKDESRNPAIYSLLNEVVNDSDFSEDMKAIHKENGPGPAKAHEIMSAVIGLQLLDKKALMTLN